MRKQEMTDQDIPEKIRRWLSQEGLLEEALQDEDLQFHFAAVYPKGSGRHVSILQPKDREDMIVVFSRIRLADAHRKALAQMPPPERERFLWRMRYDLLFQKSSFEMEPGGPELQSIHFTREIYYDGLSKNSLMEAIRENFKCELYVIWRFQEAFGDGPAAKVSGPPEPMYC